MENNNEISFIRLPEIVKITTIPKSTLLEMISDGEFPAPIKLSARSRAWVQSEVDSWMKKKIEDRNKELKNSTDNP
jgi:prophage regulatory protein